jgi:GNAT superfamily N-acetyltransferase
MNFTLAKAARRAYILIMGSELIQIRGGTRSDALDVARVHEEAWRSTYQGIIPHLHLEKIIAHRGPGWWERTLKRPGSGMLLLTFNGTVQGYASFGAARIASSPKTGEIFELYLAPVFQGMGFGKQLFLEARRLLQRQGRRRLVVWALAENEPACAFYGRLGGTPSVSAPEHYGTVTLNRLAFVWEPVGRATR